MSETTLGYIDWGHFFNKNVLYNRVCRNKLATSVCVRMLSPVKSTIFGMHLKQFKRL